MRLTIDNGKCTGCLICEITCSLIHFGQVHRETSAIRITFGHLDHKRHRSVVCRQCETMRCLRAEGRASDEALRQAYLWENRDTREADCPFGALFPAQDKLVHCNLCGGEPECVKSCPTGALRLSA